ncbi:MAG TPA: SpoIIE family protein phosphatase [Acidobacteriaceae bacterium]|jgi:sigma-B regulation protein RsbU (phosphoserine phosphatase)|nr:SpoIIE family protein phosphatase [Acidobacteriaceae bacterium]
MGQFRNFEVAVFRRIRREPPTGFAHRTAFWLFIVYFVFALLGWLPGDTGVGFHDFATLDFYILVIFCVPLLWRYVFGRLLWKVRNRLIVTYVLMGLTPVVLFVTLAALLLYVFSGQFAIFAATSVINDELAHIAAQNNSFAMHIAHTLDHDPGIRGLSLPEAGDDPNEHEYAGLTIAAFHDGRFIGLLPASVEAHDISAVPKWLPPTFRGIILDRGQLWLRAVDTQTLGGHTTVAITSVPIEKENVEAIARDLGRVSIYPGVKFENTQGPPPPKSNFQFHPMPNKDDADVKIGGESLAEARKHAVVGGSLPPGLHFYDVPVGFLAPLPTHDWSTGETQDIYADVTSRPTLLYKVLFSSSLEVGTLVRDGLIGIAITFGILELLAFLAAVRLNQTITRSVHDLYEATLAIDGGNLGHRITVRRRDQLGALGRSFNAMAASLQRLLAEQREKERLQNELAIAQEVQANLFPHGRVSLPMLELHGVCIPARTVSGDYYDFLLFGETGLGIALGDISGKGISAALLMATLHSAVRAYRFAGEELLTQGEAALADPRTRRVGEEEVECSELFEQPARILALLNRHLYRSTQPEKYATLFLSHYDGLTRRLVYSNGGHLPPLLLRADDTVTRLDRGGCVVGLLDDLHWEQGIEHFAPGDILIAYSDGITEPENDFGEFGEERLVEIVRRHRHLSLEAISEQVVQTLRTWIGGQEQPDDITLVLARQR